MNESCVGAEPDEHTKGGKKIPGDHEWNESFPVTSSLTPFVCAMYSLLNNLSLEVYLPCLWLNFLTMLSLCIANLSDLNLS